MRGAQGQKKLSRRSSVFNQIAAKVDDPYIAIGIPEIGGEAGAVGRKPGPVINAAPERAEISALPVAPVEFALGRVPAGLISENAVL